MSTPQDTRFIEEKKTLMEDKKRPTTPPKKWKRWRETMKDKEGSIQKTQPENWKGWKQSSMEDKQITLPENWKGWIQSPYDVNYDENHFLFSDDYYKTDRVLTYEDGYPIIIKKAPELINLLANNTDSVNK